MWQNQGGQLPFPPQLKSCSLSCYLRHSHPAGDHAGGKENKEEADKKPWGTDRCPESSCTTNSSHHGSHSGNRESCWAFCLLPASYWAETPVLGTLLWALVWCLHKMVAVFTLCWVFLHAARDHWRKTWNEELGYHFSEQNQWLNQEIKQLGLGSWEGWWIGRGYQTSKGELSWAGITVFPRFWAFWLQTTIHSLEAACQTPTWRSWLVRRVQ